MLLFPQLNFLTTRNGKDDIAKGFAVTQNFCQGQNVFAKMWSRQTDSFLVDANKRSEQRDQ